MQDISLINEITQAYVQRMLVVGEYSEWMPGNQYYGSPDNILGRKISVVRVGGTVWEAVEDNADETFDPAKWRKHLLAIDGDDIQKIASGVSRDGVGNPIPVEDRQHHWWRLMQENLTSIRIRKWVKDKGETYDPDAARDPEFELWVVMNDFATEAGVHSSSFTSGFWRSARVWKPNSGDDWTDVNDDMFSQDGSHDGRYGLIGPGDIIGPWVYDDLQKVLTMLRWTQIVDRDAADVSDGLTRSGISSTF